MEVMGVTALMGGVAPIVEVFMSSSLSSQSTDWMPPQVIPSIMACWLMTYVFGSAAMVRGKVQEGSFLGELLAGLLTWAREGRDRAAGQLHGEQ